MDLKEDVIRRWGTLGEAIERQVVDQRWNPWCEAETGSGDHSDLEVRWTQGLMHKGLQGLGEGRREQELKTESDRERRIGCRKEVEDDTDAANRVWIGQDLESNWVRKLRDRFGINQESESV
uniref:Uncharacterized protein n=1 Tax=Oryza brachyantha TaxID=4533 RepID=J3NAQ4_ORYBR